MWLTTARNLVEEELSLHQNQRNHIQIAHGEWPWHMKIATGRGQTHARICASNQIIQVISHACLRPCCA